MSVSADGFIADREGGFEWTAPSEELFGFHLAETRKVGGFWVVEAADQDAAVRWATQASKALGGRIEVRAFQDRQDA